MATSVGEWVGRLGRAHRVVSDATIEEIGFVGYPVLKGSI
jgi:hypothetical protein